MTFKYREDMWAQSLPWLFLEVVLVLQRLVLDALAADQPCVETLTHVGFEPAILR